MFAEQLHFTTGIETDEEEETDSETEEGDSDTNYETGTEVMDEDPEGHQTDILTHLNIALAQTTQTET